MSNEGSVLTRQKIIAELTRSPHGRLVDYIPVGVPAVRQEPDFVAHLISWDRDKGQVRDAKVAMPSVFIHAYGKDDELLDNAYAHIAKLGPREFLRAFQFARQIKHPTRMRRLYRLATRYLRNLENEGHWQRVALQHRDVLKQLYRVTHTKPSSLANRILFANDYPEGSIFDVVRNLKNMTTVEAAGTIFERKIPFLIALGALGKKAKEPDLVLALINRMTPTELVTNTKMLERLGVKENPALRGAFEVALATASKSKANVLKTSRAAEAIDDPTLKAKLQATQERQLDSVAIDGNWLVLADKSGSMQESIEASKLISATLAKLVKGKVWLVFFDTMPLTIDVTGASLDIIRKATEHIRAQGGTSIGCGLLRMLESHEQIDGIAVVSDGCENTAPQFWDVYRRYTDEFGKEVPVYLYKLAGGDDPSYYRMFVKGHDIQEFELGHTPDYYSLPNLVSTMRSNRYSLIDEIMSSKLLKLDDVLKSQRKEAGKHVSA